jgi:hypothetical protein
MSTREVLEMLQELKADTLESIRQAAAKGDSQRVLVATHRLAEIEDLLMRQEALREEIQELLSRPDGSSASPPLAQAPRPILQTSPARQVRSGESARERGNRRRLEFVRVLASKGRALTQIRGALYRNSHNNVVGVAYASERKKDGWFLGLPASEFEHAVLLCETAGERVFAVCLPKSFFHKYGPHLSESKGQMKFNVRLRAGQYVMTIPDVGTVGLDEFVDKYNLVA